MKRITVAIALALLAGAACDNNYESQAAAPAEPATPQVPVEREPVPAPLPVEPPPPAPLTPVAEVTIVETPVTEAPVVEAPETPPVPSPEELARQAEELQRNALSAASSKFTEMHTTLGEIENKIREEGDAAPETWKQLQTDLTTRLASAEAKSAELQSAPREQWQALIVDLEQLVGDLSKGFDEARKTILP